MHGVRVILIKHFYIIIVCLATVFFGSLVCFFLNDIGNRRNLDSLHGIQYLQMNLRNVAAAYNRNPHKTPQYVSLISSATCSTTFVFALEFLTCSMSKS